MNKKIILALCIITGLAIAGILISKATGQKASLTNPLVSQSKPLEKILPSNTFLEYSDPSGFKFSYPDNLSITNKNIEDNSTYADLQLFSKEVSGSISLKITDSKFSSLDDWLKASKISKTPKEVKLGNLKAQEIQLNDRLILGALDQGILFNIEMPGIEKDFWLPVYNKILADFSFAPPGDTASQGTAALEDVVFEGEEVVE